MKWATCMGCVRITLLVDVDGYVVTTYPIHKLGHLYGLCQDNGVGRCGWICVYDPPNP